MGITSYLWPSRANNSFLILIGNSIDDLSSYREFAMHLAANGITVIGFDLLAKGKSWIQRLADLKTIIDDIAAEYPQKPLSLCGISSGAFLAREYAGLYPQSIASIILLEHSVPAKLQIKTTLRKAKNGSLKNGENEFPKEILEKYQSDINLKRYNTDLLTYSTLIEITQAADRIGSSESLVKLTENLPVMCINGEDATKFANGYILHTKTQNSKFPKEFHTFSCITVRNAGCDLLLSLKREGIYDDILEWLYCHSYNKISRKDAGLPENHYYNHLIPFQHLSKKDYEQKPVWIAVKNEAGEFIETQAYISLKHIHNGLAAIMNSPALKKELNCLEYASKWFAFSEPPFDDLFIRKKEEVGEKFYHVFRYDISDPIPLSILKEELARTKGLALWLDASWRLILGEPGWAILHLLPTGEVSAFKDGKNYILPDSDYIKLWKVQTDKPE